MTPFQKYPPFKNHNHHLEVTSLRKRRLECNISSFVYSRTLPWATAWCSIAGVSKWPSKVAPTDKTVKGTSYSFGMSKQISIARTTGIASSLITDNNASVPGNSVALEKEGGKEKKRLESLLAIKIFWADMTNAATSMYATWQPFNISFNRVKWI